VATCEFEMQEKLATCFHATYSNSRALTAMASLPSRAHISCSTTPLSGNTCSLRRQRCRRAEVAEERASERTALAADAGDARGSSLHGADRCHMPRRCVPARYCAACAPLTAAQRHRCWMPLLNAHGRCNACMQRCGRGYWWRHVHAARQYALCRKPARWRAVCF